MREPTDRDAGICSSFTNVPFVESRSITNGLTETQEQGRGSAHDALLPDANELARRISLDSGFRIPKLALFCYLSVLNDGVLFRCRRVGDGYIGDLGEGGNVSAHATMSHNEGSKVNLRFDLGRLGMRIDDISV